CARLLEIERDPELVTVARKIGHREIVRTSLHHRRSIRSHKRRRSATVCRRILDADYTRAEPREQHGRKWPRQGDGHIQDSDVLERPSRAIVSDGHCLKNPSRSSRISASSVTRGTARSR